MTASDAEKPLVWLHGEVKTPPFSREGRIGAGTLLRRLQRGEKLSLPYSRPMPVVGSRCHELRIQDQDVIWRIMYRVDSDAVIVAEMFAKKTSATPQQVIDVCKQRLRNYDKAAKEQDS
jgi:phage-related protein